MKVEERLVLCCEPLLISLGKIVFNEFVSDHLNIVEHFTIFVVINYDFLVRNVMYS